jgi:RNA polymerase sigma factor (sigma-70 family)
LKEEAMVYSILKKFGLYSKKEDYIDICYIGYAKALKKYDRSKSKMITYIYKCIENELLCELRKQKALKRQHEESSFDFVYDDKGHDLNDLIGDTVDIEAEAIKKEEKEQLCEAFKTLTKREQYVIKYAFGLDCEEKTQDEMSEELGVTQSQVSRIKNKALAKLKGKMK